MSDFETELNALEARRCPTCHGTGECDDAEPGDTSFRKWKCEACKGTGKTPAATPVPVVDVEVWLCTYCDLPNTVERKACCACGHRRAQ